MASTRGELTLGDILSTAGIEPHDVLVIKHNYREQPAIPMPEIAYLPTDATDEQVRYFTSQQDRRTSGMWVNPPKLWLVFLAETGRTARFRSAYENFGPLVGSPADLYQYFDLAESPALSALKGRLTIQWPIRYFAQLGPGAWNYPVVEVANTFPFPGFDRVCLSHAKLVEVMHRPEYSEWRALLRSSQGIYVIADTSSDLPSSGKLYVGKAAGRDGFLGRWKSYAETGHADNEELKALLAPDPSHVRHLQFSALRVFGLGSSPGDLDRAEDHYKRVLMSRRPFGLNAN